MKTIIKYLFWIIFLLLVWYILYLFVWNRQTQNVISSTTISVVSQLRSVKILESAQMTITKIVEWEKQQSSWLISSISIISKIENALFQDKIVLEVEWVISAGFDMEKLKTWSVKVYADNSVSIMLPPAEILSVKLTPNTKPYDRTLWIFTKWNVELETQIRNQAIEMIKADSLKAWILQQAEVSARETLINLLQSMNVKVREVTIEKNM
jgi:hypothetical protein